MGVRIEFRGNLYLQYQGDTLERVLLPNCPREETFNGKGKKKLTGRRHYAGILVHYGTGERNWYSLAGQRDVRISDGTAITHLPFGISRLLPNPVGVKPGAMKGKATAAIELGLKGVWSAIPDPSGAFEYRISEESAIDVLMLALAIETHGRVRIEGLKRELELMNGDWACVYSYDIEEPTREQLYHVELGENSVTQDDDFAWIYDLFDSAPGERVVPTVREGPNIRTPNVSTCFPGGGT